VSVAVGFQGSGQQFGGRGHVHKHLRERYAGDFTEHVVDRYCVARTPEECAARVREYVDAGAQHIVFNIAELEDAERLAEVAFAAAR
jgi:alkanesulfonate monooxygenase SsuD/methylene tetrahydromethanopterin reductase-like flavin-dependent oxidoreductase (luciferase family)